MKESVVIREQRHILARKEPGFNGKLAKLFGWTDASGSTSSISPLIVSPVRSRSVSPICSPTNTHRKEGSDGLDDNAGREANADKRVEDAVVGRAELSKRLGLLDTPNVEIFGDVAGKGSGKESQMRVSPPYGVADPAAPLTTDYANKESVTAACLQCTQLHQQLETALTDRTLAEAELVSMRRVMSRVDTAWECESSGGGNIRQKAENAQSETEVDPAGDIRSLLPPGRIGGDRGLRDELDRLDARLVIFGRSDAAPSMGEGNAVGDQGRPKLQVRHWIRLNILAYPKSLLV